MKSKSYLFISSFILMLLFSCDKEFEELNKDPHGFTTASDGSLFNGIIQSIVLGGNEQFYINNEILYKQTQLSALTGESWGNYTLGTEDLWNNYYGALTEIRELEKRMNEMQNIPEVKNMKAMVKIALAYKTFKLTDLFGDIPFSLAGYGFQDFDYLLPAFDSQEEIYKSLLDDLKWADENINESAMGEPLKTFKTFDKLFNGDMEYWRKFGNSLRLRYAVRMSGKEPEYAGEIIKDIIENDKPVLVGYYFLSEKLESACLWPAEIGFKNTSVNWSFREHNNLRLGSNVWHQLSENDNMDGSGIFDPRAYVFFEPNYYEQWNVFPQISEINTPPSGGIPYGEQRDSEGYLFHKGEENIYGSFNYFLIRDEDFIPIILFTGAEVHFLKAEAYFRGLGVAVNMNEAENEYLNGMNASVNWWRKVADNSTLPLSGMKFNENILIPDNVNLISLQNHFGMWNAESEEEKLEFIYTQRWLDAFRQPWEAYALCRRTGKTPREGDAINHFRLPYPPSEVEYNTLNCSNAISRQGGDSPEHKIWWIP